MTLALIACGALTLATLGLGVAGQRGRLPRNCIAGIRTTKILRDDQSWTVGHRAAAPVLIALGVLGIATMVLIALSPATMTNPLLYGYIAVVLLGLAFATWVAGKAVDQLDTHG